GGATRRPGTHDFARRLDSGAGSGHAQNSADPAHAAASRFNASVSWDELTARVDWHYDGAPPARRGHVKHVAMFVWADGAAEEAKQRALDAVRRLAEAPGVEAVTIGHNVGRLVSDYDWIMDVQLPDRTATERLLRGPHYAGAMEPAAAVTKYEETAPA